MKAFLVLCLAAVAMANPQLLYNAGLPLPLRYAGAPLLVAPAPVAILPSTQYHAQNEIGGYSYGYASADGQVKNEVRNLDGTVQGSYSYVDPEGKPVQVNYAADALGFRVLSNNLPVPPALPEANVRAIAEHQAARAEALARASVNPQ